MSKDTYTPEPTLELRAMKSIEHGYRDDRDVEKKQEPRPPKDDSENCTQASRDTEYKW